MCIIICESLTHICKNMKRMYVNECLHASTRVYAGGTGMCICICVHIYGYETHVCIYDIIHIENRVQDTGNRV